MQLLKRKDPIPWLYFDFKQDLRHVREESIWILRWNWLRINPLQPPNGVSIEQWMQIVADTCAHCFGWFHGSENYLLEFMQKLYELYKGEGYPTLQELHKLMTETEERSRKRLEYFDVVMNRIKSLLIVLKDVINCRVGFPIEELLEHPVVIELDGLRRDEQNFLVELMLAYIFAYRLASGHRGKSHLHLLVFDEATRIFYRKREWRETTIELGMPFIDIVPQILRDYSEGMLFTAQEPSLISHSVLANTNLKMIGFLGEGEDIERIEQSLDLNEEERSAISKLECGEWLVSKHGLKPFLLRSYDYQIEKNVTDEELEKRMLPVLLKLGENVLPKIPLNQTCIKKQELPNLSKDAEKFLFNVNSHPFKGLSGHYAMLGFSGRRAETTKNELIQKGLVKEVSVTFGSHRPSKFLVVTDLGLRYLKNAKQETKLWEYIGNVSFEHRLYQVLIAYSFKNAGHKAFIEKDMGEDRRLDVLAIQDNKKIGIEIELNQNIDLNKILRSLKELDELKIICADQTTVQTIKEKIERFVYPNLRRKISIHSVKDYLLELKNNLTANKDGKKSDYEN